MPLKTPNSMRERLKNVNGDDEMSIFKIIGIAVVINWVIGLVSILWKFWVEDESIESWKEFFAVLLLSCLGIVLPVSFFLNRRKSKF